MKNVNELLNSKTAGYLRKRFNATDDEIIRTELFYQDRYKEDDVTIMNFDKYAYDSFEMCDLFDYYLRTTEDQDVIELDTEQAATYLLYRHYSCNSHNEYDYNFLYENLDLEKFVNRCIENHMDDALKKVNGKYYLIEDDYVLNRRISGYLF